MLCFLHTSVNREKVDRYPWVEKEKSYHSREGNSLRESWHHCVAAGDNIGLP